MELGTKLFAIFVWFLRAAKCSTSQDIAIGNGEVIVVILSQSNSYHEKLSSHLQQNIVKQSLTLGKDPIAVKLAHKDFPLNNIGAWTVLPLLPQIAESFKDKKWVFFCEEETELNLKGVFSVLKRYNSAEPQFLGKPLRDREWTIIHHYADPKLFTYPDFAAGFALSVTLIKSLAERIEKKKLDFHIDTKHELAKFIWNDGNGTSLIEIQEFCAGNENEKCVTNFPNKAPSCGAPISNDDLFIAVKTCSKFHKDRVPVVLETWGPHSKHMKVYSDVQDESIPTENIGVSNVERGHCMKTFQILKKMKSDPDISNFKWFVIVDDDTILSVSRLRHLLACYNPNEKIHLGERYGYGVGTGQGYNYITGGGGMIFSAPLVDILVGDGTNSICHSLDSPDDMMLGMFMKRNSIPVLHSPLFHQARPMDYSEGYLSHQIPVSFHKHWNVDPREVYKTWFEEEDEKIVNESQIPAEHEEL